MALRLRIPAETEKHLLEGFNTLTLSVGQRFYSTILCAEVYDDSIIPPSTSPDIPEHRMKLKIVIGLWMFVIKSISLLIKYNTHIPEYIKMVYRKSSDDLLTNLINVPYKD